MTDSTEPDWYEEIDHTGDVGIRIHAPQLDTLFARAAWGLFNVIADLNPVEPSESVPFTVEADDREDLLRRWLTDLNYFHSTEHYLFSRFSIETLSPHALVAQAEGEPIDPDRHQVYTEVKAITFHGLRIWEDDAQWHGQIIFDM